MDRKERLQLLVNEFHTGKLGDYDDSYNEFAATYGLETEDSEFDTCDVCGEERRALVHTDTTLHPDDAVDGLTLHKFSPLTDEPEPIPQYAITSHDETYSMVEVFSTLDDALAGLLGCVGQDTLNIPGNLIDLDTGEVLEYRMSIVATGNKLDVSFLNDLKEN